MSINLVFNFMKYRLFTEEKKRLILALRFGEGQTGRQQSVHLGFEAISRVTRVPYTTVRYVCTKHTEARTED